ncbi:5-dehydro-4-deoxy-D-glucuronate isomerase [Candidatus Neomarinimicrobiota bacterium]
MDIRYLGDPYHYELLDTDELRQVFLIDDLFAAEKLVLHYTDADRGIVGSAVPVDKAIELVGSKELAAEYFAERREVGVINIGASGTVTVDGEIYALDNRDALYIGRGNKQISFASADKSDPAKFYIQSYPAHTVHPTVKVTKAEATIAELGSPEEANVRKIYKLIHSGIMPTCQLVMGYTELAPGSVWNTMPPHTHERRTEVYMYFDLGDEPVFHFMGKPDATRHIVVRDGQAVASPSWSIHSGVGTSNYTFIWGMGGENQAFDDMDHIAKDDLE